jgi:hypothetical protein
LTLPFEPVTVPDAGDLDREGASTYVGRWTAFCMVGAIIAEAVVRLVV